MRRDQSSFIPASMLSIERTKELLDDPSISDEEAEQIRDECRILAEIVFELWRENTNNE